MTKNKKKISIVAGCFNEKNNLQEFYDRLIAVFKRFPQYDYEIIIADNCSTDGSRDVLRQIAIRDRKFKVILNSNNFGSIRSPHNAFLQATGDAVVAMVSDLQDPPEIIIDMIRQWEAGYLVVIAVKPKTKENFLIGLTRKFYYRLLDLSSSSEMIKNFTGFGLYDRKFMEALKKYNDPYPYFRGLISEIGFKRIEIEYIQDVRKHGKSKSSLLVLYDVAMTGFVNHSKLPLRLATFLGFSFSVLCFLIALYYFIMKLIYWYTFSFGLAPIIIGLFFSFAIQLVFIGIVGEYIGAIFIQTKNKPLAIEDEKINFDDQK